jgi:hypothetical protein
MPSASNTTNTSSTKPWYSLYAYTSDPEWSMWPVDTVVHTSTRRASRRRILTRLATRFADLPSHKIAAVQASVSSALAHRWGYRAWAIHLQAFGETLFVIRNTAYTLQDPKDRRVCVLHLEDVLLRRHTLEVQELTWTEEIMLLGFTFVLGALVAWQVYPMIHAPTLLNACKYTFARGLLHI